MLFSGSKPASAVAVSREDDSPSPVTQQVIG